MFMNYDIENILNDIDFESNKLVKCDNFMLTNKEIEVLKKYNIEYEKCINLKELIFYIEDILQEEDVSDLEEIEKSISERDYYENTNK